MMVTVKVSTEEQAADVAVKLDNSIDARSARIDCGFCRDLISKDWKNRANCTDDDI